MSRQAEGNDSQPLTLVNINVRGPAGSLITQEIDLSQTTVAEFKEALEIFFEVPIQRQRLVTAGRVMEDNRLLSEYPLKEGSTIFLAALPSASSAAAAASNSNSNSNRSTADSSGSAARASFPSSAAAPAFQSPFAPEYMPWDLTGGMNGEHESFEEMSRRQMAMLQQNPELLRSIMNSPAMKALRSNPDMMRAMINSNPATRDLMERNPEFRHVLNNDSFLQQMIDLSANPNLMREHLRQQDQMISNIESIPGAANQLYRLYATVQQPLEEAMNNQNRPLPTQSNPIPEREPSAGPNTDPLPNPWAPRRTPAASSTHPQFPQLTSQQSPFGAHLGSGGLSSPNGLFPSLANNPMGLNSSSQVRLPVNLRQQFARELALLEEMGFSNADANLAALVATRGDVEAAAIRLAEGQF